MSITAIANLVVAAGGKAAQPGLGDILPGNGLPLDFAAILAGQIPLPDTTASTTQTAESRQPDADLLSGLIPQASVSTEKTRPVDDKKSRSDPEIDESAAAILAALAVSPKQTAPAPATSDKQLATTDAVAESGKDKKQGAEKEGDDEKGKTTVDAGLAPADPGLLAQYAAQMAAQAVQNRAPDSATRGNPAAPGQIAKTNSSLTPGKEGRSALPEHASASASEERPSSPSAPALPAAQATPAPESRIIPRSDTANAAILAGDPNAGNSANTPAFATALAATSAANTNGTAAAQPAEPPKVTAALNSPNWSHDFGSKVVWLAKNDQQVAQININPPQLGPVQISISISGDQATTTFASPHPEVRQAIQDSLPQLREMFSTAGISLGQANVGSQLPSQNREAAFQFANEARSVRENAILSPDSHPSAAPTGIPIQRGRGLVDLFA